MLIAIVALVLLIGWMWAADVRRKRLAREALERRRLDLVSRFGAEVAERILRRSIWQGATPEMLIESIGRPADIDERVMKAKTRHVFKYYERGRGKFALRITFEDNVLVGWDDKR